MPIIEIVIVTIDGVEKPKLLGNEKLLTMIAGAGPTLPDTRYLNLALNL